tara:strand:- start:6489 stop:6800 length:312 start_codon:yes stop_codon:yes gene_type:complete
MANRRRFGVKTKKGGQKLQDMRRPRKPKFGKAPPIVPAIMGGSQGLINFGLGKLFNPQIKRKVLGEESPKKRSTPKKSIPKKSIPNQISRPIRTRGTQRISRK